MTDLPHWQQAIVECAVVELVAVFFLITFTAVLCDFLIFRFSISVKSLYLVMKKMRGKGKLWQ